MVYHILQRNHAISHCLNMWYTFMFYSFGRNKERKGKKRKKDNTAKNIQTGIKGFEFLLPETELFGTSIHMLPGIPKTTSLVYPHAVLGQPSNTALVTLPCNHLFLYFPKRPWDLQSGEKICFTFKTLLPSVVLRIQWVLLNKHTNIYLDL